MIEYAKTYPPPLGDLGVLGEAHPLEGTAAALLAVQKLARQTERGSEQANTYLYIIFHFNYRENSLLWQFELV